VHLSHPEVLQDDPGDVDDPAREHEHVLESIF
jgi:hypothetical protein